MDGNQILQMHPKDWEAESQTFCETLTIATVVSRGCDQLHQSIKHLIKRRREHWLGWKPGAVAISAKGILVHRYKIFLLMFGCLITEHLTWVLIYLCNLAQSMKMALNPSTQKWTLRIVSVIARVGVLQLFVFLASIGGVFIKQLSGSPHLACLVADERLRILESSNGAIAEPTHYSHQCVEVLQLQ